MPGRSAFSGNTVTTLPACHCTTVGKALVLLHRGFDCLGVSRIERGQVGIGYLDSDAPGGAGLA